jgi:ectoine hydroxylase-related dioxygenase (phytanoyl-CoA dioxygenase family)
MPGTDSPKNAQLWHRDRDDMQILKVFIYFTDVDEETGAFVYAPGTHALGTITKQPAYFLEDGKTKRSYDEDMNKIVPQDKWLLGKGSTGTIVFADTHGYHKGGFVKTKFRFLYTCMYLSGYSGRIRFDNVTS